MKFEIEHVSRKRIGKRKLDDLRWPTTIYVSTNDTQKRIIAVNHTAQGKPSGIP